MTRQDIVQRIIEQFFLLRPQFAAGVDVDAVVQVVLASLHALPRYRQLPPDNSLHEVSFGAPDLWVKWDDIQALFKEKS